MSKLFSLFTVLFLSIAPLLLHAQEALTPTSYKLDFRLGIQAISIMRPSEKQPFEGPLSLPLELGIRLYRDKPLSMFYEAGMMFYGSRNYIAAYESSSFSSTSLFLGAGYRYSFRQVVVSARASLVGGWLKKQVSNTNPTYYKDIHSFRRDMLVGLGAEYYLKPNLKLGIDFNYVLRNELGSSLMFVYVF